MGESVEQQIVPVRGAKLWPLSVEAYHVLGEAGVIPENTELLYGLVYSKMPISPLHTLLLYRLLPLLQALALRGLWLRSEQPLTLRDSEPQADISIVKGSVEDYGRGHPSSAELVMEICVTSHDYDRSKLRAYATANIKECWLILGPEKRVEIHSEPKNGEYQNLKVFGPTGRIESSTLPSVWVDLDVLFAPPK